MSTVRERYEALIRRLRRSLRARILWKRFTRSIWLGFVVILVLILTILKLILSTFFPTH